MTISSMVQVPAPEWHLDREQCLGAYRVQLCAVLAEGELPCTAHELLRNSELAECEESRLTGLAERARFLPLCSS